MAVASVVAALNIWMKFVELGAQSRPGPGANGPDGFDFEKDPIRFVFETTMREYETVRREIEMMILQQERTFNYLLALVGALLASQLLVDEFPTVEAKLNENPSLYLFLGLTALWFPVQNVILNAHIATMAAYLRTVLIPRVNAMVDSVESPTLNTYKSTVEASMPSSLHGLLAWEAYRADSQFDRVGSLLIFAPMWLYRFAVLAIPSLVLFGRYIDIRWIRRDIDWLAIAEFPALLAAALLVVGLVLGGFLRANLAATHRELSAMERKDV